MSCGGGCSRSSAPPQLRSRADPAEVLTRCLLSRWAPHPLRGQVRPVGGQLEAVGRGVASRWSGGWGGAGGGLLNLRQGWGPPQAGDSPGTWGPWCSGKCHCLWPGGEACPWCVCVPGVNHPQPDFRLLVRPLWLGTLEEVGTVGSWEPAELQYHQQTPPPHRG